jgi:PadR family transcriptional regulator, regulatory protein PadR
MSLLYYISSQRGDYMLGLIVIVCATQYSNCMAKDTELTSQSLELRRGIVVLAILSQLDEPRYGYGLLQRLDERGIAIDAGTLYPLMRRLEKQGILESTWNTEEVRPRKYYNLSREGRRLYKQLLQEWRTMTASIQDMTKGDI